MNDESTIVIEQWAFFDSANPQAFDLWNSVVLRPTEI